MTDPNDYSKNRIAMVDFPQAAQLIANGWVAARDSWPAGTIVFMASEGTFTAKDLITGYMGAFLVQRSPAGNYTPWSPNGADVHATDWTCLTRQTFQHQVSDRLPHGDTHQRDTKRVATEPSPPGEPKRIYVTDYKADGDADTTDMS